MREPIDAAASSAAPRTRVTRVTHVVGAGLAGLAAALAIADTGAAVVLHEAAPQAGGRCRSYRDPVLGMLIDNGNHLVLSGNRETMAYLRAIGASDRLVGPPSAAFPFIDLANGERWTLRLSDSRIPWWIFNAARRVAGTRPLDYLALVRLLRVPRGSARTVAELAGGGKLYERLTRPLFLAALNTDPAEGSAELAAAVMRETLVAGGQACRPLVARTGLSDALIDPALERLRTLGVTLRLGSRLRHIELTDGQAGAGARATRLEFDGNGDTTTFDLAPDDQVVLAVPPGTAGSLLPGLTVPDTFRAIVNAHFRTVPPPGCPPVIGVINGTTEWVFAFDDRLSVTISGADRLLDIDRETLARTIWQEVAMATGLAGSLGDAGPDGAAAAASPSPPPLPPWQIVREKRATFAALPAQESRRPATLTRWRNLFLAGDWTATGLPATIEGAIRSGNRAGHAALDAARSTSL